MIRLLIVDDVASTRENLQKLLSFEDDIEVVGMAGDGKAGLAEAHRIQPDIVLTDVNMPLMDGIQLTETLAQELPSSPVIIMSVQGERDYLRRAMQAGAREFLIKPFSPDELVAAIRRVHQLEEKKGAFLPKGGAGGDGELAATRPAALGEVITLFSGKGGVGKTLLATNLAAALAKETGASVVLVDLGLQFGDVGVMLNLDHSRSLIEVLDSIPSLDADSLQDVLAQGPDGVKVLVSPISPELADLVTHEHLQALLGQLRKFFDYVVVDTSSHLDERTIEILEASSRILVITALTIPALKDTKLTLKVLESLKVDPASVTLVVNRADEFADFNRDAIEQNLGQKVAVQIPHEARIVGESITRGEPAVVLHPEAEISRAFRELVSRLVPEAAVVKTGDGKKKRLFGR